MSELDTISNEVKSYGQGLVDLNVEEHPPFWYRWVYLSVSLDSLESVQETISQQEVLFGKRKYFFVDQTLSQKTLTSIWTQDPLYG